MGCPEKNPDTIQQLEAQLAAQEPETVSIESQLKSMISAQTRFANDTVREKDNFKDALMELVQKGVLQREQANRVVILHNDAPEDEVYGERLMQYLMKLEQQGTISREELARLYVLSIDWPLEYKIDMFNTYSV